MLEVVNEARLAVACILETMPDGTLYRYPSVAKEDIGIQFDERNRIIEVLERDKI